LSEIVVSVEGFERVFAVLDRLENPQWDRLLTAIGLTIEEQTVYHFREGAGPEGAWAPRKSGGSKAILVATGRLIGSITFAVKPPDTVIIGTAVKPYPRFHQEGRQHLPRRMFMGLTESDKTELGSVIETYIEGLAS